MLTTEEQKRIASIKTMKNKSNISSLDVDFLIRKIENNNAESYYLKQKIKKLVEKISVFRKQMLAVMLIFIAVVLIIQVL